MEIKLKRVPFDIELAKKITEGKIKGAKIIDGFNRQVRILAFDIQGKYSIAATVKEDEEECIYSYTDKGNYLSYKSEHERNLSLLVPVHYNAYSNFVPQKWQPCLVRDLTGLPWIIRVATGNSVNGNFTFYNDDGGTSYFIRALPISKKTIQLLGTTKSYEQLLEEEWTNEE